MSCGGKLGNPLELRQGPQGTSLVASGKSSLLSRCEGEDRVVFESLQVNWPHLILRGESRGVPRVPVGRFGSSLVVTGTAGNLSYCLRDVRPPFKLRGTLRDYSRVSEE